MHAIKHTTAKPSHYDSDVKFYDDYQESYNRPINKLVTRLLKKYGVHSVLDLTCGTGSQVFWLHERGFDVVGADFNELMIASAKQKAKKAKTKTDFVVEDMRTIRVGTFDAAISMSSAIGHLTSHDFQKAIRNVSKNLVKGGIYVFDIFNLVYLLHGDNITKMTIDWLKRPAHKTIRLVQYSTITADGNFASYTVESVQKGSAAPKVTSSAQTLQVYSSKNLKDMLAKNGFKVIHQCDMAGKRLNQRSLCRLSLLLKKYERSGVSVDLDAVYP